MWTGIYIYIDSAAVQRGKFTEKEFSPLLVKIYAAMKHVIEEISKLLPKYQGALMGLPEGVKAKATDIRLSVGYSPLLFLGRERCPIKNAAPISMAELQDLVFTFCDFSVYKHVEEIKQGFISVKGRYRVGICGTAVLGQQGIENIKDIRSVTIRVPRLIYGAAEELRRKVKELDRGLLIVGEPSSGKTTILRDLMVMLSERRLAVLDQRWELTGGFNLGDIDALCGYPKDEGIRHAIRNLGSEILICDELEAAELPSVAMAAASGVSIIATVHGALDRGVRPLVYSLVKTGAFPYIVQLNGRDRPCSVGRVWEAGELLENFRSTAFNMCGNTGRLGQNSQAEPESPPFGDIW